MMDQLLLHLFGDYIIQNEWMARNKVKSHFATLVHVITYSLPFLLISSPLAMFFIGFTHFFIDRYSLAKYFIYFKNYILTKADVKWENCKNNFGFNIENVPPHIAFFVYVGVDNSLHLIINYFLIKHL